jgi:tetratricopeptide (TPR) repeat protein
VKRRLLLVIASLLLTLGGIELALRLLGVAAPFRAFEIVTGDDGVAMVQTRLQKTPRYRVHDARFPLHKTPGRLRVFVFGGSTTYGMPYTFAAGKDGDVSFGPWLRADLQPRHGIDIEVINCGAIGMPVDGVRDLVEECLDYEPDLFLVLSGHNEFLPHALLPARSAILYDVGSPWRRLRLAALLERGALSLAEIASKGHGTKDYPIVDTLVSPAFHTPAEYELIVRRYRETLEWIAEACRERGVPLVLGTPPGNLLDYEPSSSSLTTADADDVSRWVALVRDGRAALEAGKIDEARATLERAVAAHPEGAEAHYRLGLALAKLGDTAGARRELEDARDLDGAIRRAPGDLLGVVRDVVKERAGQQRLVLADCDAAFARASAPGLPGRNLFVDHVHPNLDGVALIADVMRVAMEELPVVDAGGARSAPDRAAIERALKINANLLFAVDLLIGRNYANLLMLRHYDPDWRYGIAASHLQRVIDREPRFSPALAMLGGLQVVAKKPELARASFQAAERVDPNWKSQIVPLIKESRAIEDLFREQGFGDLLDENPAKDKR